MIERVCRRCAGPLVTPRTGRPPTFCSTACRRAAEYEVRRLSRRLERLETEAADLCVQLHVIEHRDAAQSDEYRAYWSREPAARLAGLTHEIAAAEQRLATLLTQ
jgi:hypothetical protein